MSPIAGSGCSVPSAAIWVTLATLPGWPPHTPWAGWVAKSAKKYTVTGPNRGP
jgi:hypothetical protein